ncbi:GNAT family N-acetyltransferase [Aquidulcibacter sp.]|uniref:GNAT family N-acetyltransferase n=1 Tax=Aquidulcibacter sp. TaxID=2052990 RepID=UPI0037C03DF3
MDLSAIQRIEQATVRGWPAARMDIIDGWQVFSGLGYVGRTNSCWPLMHEGTDVEASIDRVEVHYGALGLAPQFKLVTAGTDPLDLSDRLARRGYRIVSQVAVMTREGPMAAPEHVVDIEPKFTADFIQIVSETSHSGGDGQERVDILGRVPNPSAFGIIRQNGALVAAGLCTFAGDSAGIAAMRTQADYRNRGLARSILRAIIGQAYQAGYRLFWLQVETNNGPALHLYESEGFATAYQYQTVRLER